MVDLEAIRTARERLAGQVARTPCPRAQHVSEACGGDVFLKLESAHRTGSFKERGALNKILTLGEEERARGVITASAGNHAQAVAYRARQHGIRATVVMPVRTPLVKVANTRRLGAEVVLEGDDFDAAVAHARALQEERGLVFLHGFDDDAVIAGQGTIGLELAEQVEGLDVVVTAIGGGGLIAGIATALDAVSPETRIVGVEAAAVPSMSRSLAEQRPVTVPPGQTIADGIAVKRPGERTLAIVERLVDEIVTVDEEEIANALLFLLEREKILVEGAAAATLAALLHGHVRVAEGERCALVLGGGNVDMNLLARIISRGLMKDQRLVRFDVKLQDRPGALAGLLKLVGDAGANVLEVHHERAFEDVSLGEVSIELTLETRGDEHAAAIVAAVEERGFDITERPEAFWRPR